MKEMYRLAIGMAAIALVTGCDNHPAGQHSISTPAGRTVIRVQDPKLIEAGLKVYRQHCMSCHGASAEGSLNWRKKGPDGMWPPPPLNGQGHAWHHPTQVLKRMILYGSDPGKGNMPAWEGKLTEHEVDAVIAWLQSQWPDPIYAIWRDREENTLNE